LDGAEWEGVVGTCITHAKGRVPVIAGTGTNSTAATVAKTKRALELGADAALIVTPYYNKPTQEGLYQHYTTVAKAVPQLPIILYNVPGRTGCDMLPETVERLSKVGSIIATKEAAGKIERFADIRKRCGPDFVVYSGEDGLACESIKQGGDGVISVTANVAPGLFSRMCKAGLAKDFTEAERLDSFLTPLHKALFCEPNPTPSKFLLKEMGKIKGGIRLPLLPLTSANEGLLREALKTSQQA